jgi:hypothetical protein
VGGDERSEQRQEENPIAMKGDTHQIKISNQGEKIDGKEVHPREERSTDTNDQNKTANFFLSVLDRKGVFHPL